jgi:hypothetical protein
MASTVIWNGLEEYMAELKQLPEACLGEAGKAIEGEVNGAFVAVAQVYERHRFTGTLRRRLTISHLAIGTHVYGVVLKSGSPLAWLFDNGSQARHWKSGKGTGEMWGKTSNPPTHTFSRAVGKARRKLSGLFREMLLRHGAATVLDDAA